MVSITFYTDGSHVHQRGRPEEKYCRRDCDESRRVKDALNDGLSAFQSGGGYDRAFRNLDRRREPITTGRDVPMNTMHLQRPNLEEKKSNLCRLALTIGAIATVALGVGYLSYQNTDAIVAAGQTAKDFMQKAWENVSCRFSYSGCS